MENDQELRQKFSKVLGAPRDTRNAYNEKLVIYSWEEIFNEIGKLQERAHQPPQIIKELWPNTNPMPLNYPEKNPNLHYHPTLSWRPTLLSKPLCLVLK